MQLNIREFFLKEGNNSNILNNKSVYTILLKIIKICLKGINFFVVKRNVEGTVKTTAGKLLLKGNNFFVLVFVKIISLYTEGKLF